MPGTWITRLARRVTRPDTFERLVSPAIADLQAEAAHRWTRRLLHYGAFTVVLGCAVLRDVRLDLRTAFDADSWRRVWSRAAAWALLGGLLNWVATYVLTVRLLERLDGPANLQTAVLNGVVFRSIVPGMVAALVVATYLLRRRNPAGLRTALAAAVVFIVATPLAGFVATALQTPAREALEQSYRIARPDLPPTMMMPQRMQALAGMVQTAAFAWLGVALARYRGWTLAANATTILTIYVTANLYLMQWATRMAPSLNPILYATSAIPANAVILAALILSMQTIQRQFDGQQPALPR